VRVLVTGAAGFIGSHLCALLGERMPQVQIRALVRPGRDTDHIRADGVEVVECDLLDPRGLERVLDGVDTVFHLAGVTMARDAAGYEQGNVQVTASLVQAVNRTKARRFIFVSSQAAGGPSSLPPGLTGREAARPVSWYGQSKLQAELELRALMAHWTVLRPPMVYGPRDKGFLPLFRAARLGIVPLPDGGRAPMSIAHVADVCSLALDAAAGGQPSGQIYYPSDGITRTWGEICRAVASAVGGRAMGLPFPARLIWPVAMVNGLWARLGGKPQYLNPDKYREAVQAGWLCSGLAAERELGWRAGVELSAGMAETARWYRLNGWLGPVFPCWPWS
jgi:nucleoside-diphosphate-sugar epimerase